MDALQSDDDVHANGSLPEQLPEELPLLPEHPPPGTASASAAATAESTRASERAIGPLYGLRRQGLPSEPLCHVM
jgi:hypothetical protein